MNKDEITNLLVCYFSYNVFIIKDTNCKKKNHNSFWRMDCDDGIIILYLIWGKKNEKGS
ncbi:MAG: hypothetical protein K0R71_240 [Bacillales bacterium]|jgi:hypothetical protein|nr:hypothetical protein [Bacillales bacterium]